MKNWRFEMGRNISFEVIIDFLSSESDSFIARLKGDIIIIIMSCWQHGLLPSIPIIHHLWLILLTASCACTELMLANAGVSMCRSPSEENIVYEFILTSPAVTCMSCLDFLGDRKQVAIQLLFLWDAASRICSEQHITFLCSSNLTFSPRN